MGCDHAIMPIAAKIGCTAQTLNEWVKKAEVRAGPGNLHGTISGISA